MKRFFTFIAVIAIIPCHAYARSYSKEAYESLCRLDRTLDDAQTYEKFKQEHIEFLKTRLTSCTDRESTYRILDELYEEYNKYDLDSTLRYASLKLDVAKECENRFLMDDATLDVADIYIMSGMYHEAFDITEQSDINRLESSGLLPRYYHLMNCLYGGFAHVAEELSLKNEYAQQRAEYRRRLYDCIGEDDISRLYIRTEMLIDSMEYDKAIVALRQRKLDKDISTHEKAVINYMLGLSYKKTGDIENALISYAESAIHDLKTPIRDYKSLYELAELLYQKGDFERASRYITRSIMDADAANVRINIEIINSLLPVIYNSYNSSMIHKNRILYVLLIGISLLLFLLIITTLNEIKGRREIVMKEKEVRESNIELTKANERLQRYISRLREANEIKETYISRYIDLCSDYIGRLDLYRSELRKLSKAGGYEAILKELRSTDVIDKELSEFYAQFDATFLDLFPDFISQLNSLLLPNKQMVSKDGLLTTELRVCALIRLGVIDSVKISEFLRRSVSTIYNYRVKMRNAAINKREDFENEIMKIGKQP